MGGRCELSGLPFMHPALASSVEPWLSAFDFEQLLIHMGSSLFSGSFDAVKFALPSS